MASDFSAKPEFVSSDVLGAEEGGTDELGAEEGGTDVLARRAAPDELGAEAGGTDVLGAEEGGTDVLGHGPSSSTYRSTMVRSSAWLATPPGSGRPSLTRRPAPGPPSGRPCRARCDSSPRRG